jgi:uncharacterized protein YqjF (DUF2071 family)
MHQNWHHLLFLHWEVPPQELQALVPPQLTVDLFEGKAYIGLIPFTITGVRPVLAPPLPGLSSFHEVNVRTYVHDKGRNPGVWFFSLDASSHLAVTAARAAYKLPYFYASIAMDVSADALPRIDYTAHRDDARGNMPAHIHTHYGPVEGPVSRAVPGTLDHFLIERYILYSMDADHQIHRARVHHAPYPIQKAEVGSLDESLIWAAGVRRPQNVAMRHYSAGVSVKVYPPERVSG